MPPDAMFESFVVCTVQTMSQKMILQCFLFVAAGSSRPDLPANRQQVSMLPSRIVSAFQQTVSPV